jgi:hypothetical protein
MCGIWRNHRACSVLSLRVVTPHQAGRAPCTNRKSVQSLVAPGFGPIPNPNAHVKDDAVVRRDGIGDAKWMSRFLRFPWAPHRPHGFEIRESEKTSRHAGLKGERGTHACRRIEPAADVGTDSSRYITHWSGRLAWPAAWVGKG